MLLYSVLILSALLPLTFLSDSSLQVMYTSINGCNCDDGYVIADSLDYVSNLNTLEFGSCSNKSCTSITIVDDTQIEDDESFITQPQTSTKQLVINPSRATVFIVNDSDGIFTLTLTHASYVITIPILRLW